MGRPRGPWLPLLRVPEPGTLPRAGARRKPGRTAHDMGRPARAANVQEAQSASGPERKGSGPLTIFFGARQCAEVACVLGPNGRPNAFDASASQDWAGMPIPDERTLPLRSIRNHEPTERPRLGS
jgi:hypothetical protein